MLGPFERTEYRLRQLFQMTDKAEKSIKPFFYSFIEPDVDMTSIKTDIDVNWVIFFPIKVRDVSYMITCMRDLLIYMTGSDFIYVNENVPGVVFTFYLFRD
jgi:hypothetical protein